MKKLSLKIIFILGCMSFLIADCSNKKVDYATVKFDFGVYELTNIKAGMSLGEFRKLYPAKEATQELNTALKEAGIIAYSIMDGIKGIKGPKDMIFLFGSENPNPLFAYAIEWNFDTKGELDNMVSYYTNLLGIPKQIYRHNAALVWCNQVSGKPSAVFAEEIMLDIMRKNDVWLIIIRHPGFIALFDLRIIPHSKDIIHQELEKGRRLWD